MTLNLDTSNRALAHRYDDIPYDALPHRATHPERLATVAALAGYAASPPERCRVLEVGCSNGANLIAMAVSLPTAHFIGCDLSPRAIADGRRTLGALALTNVTLLESDLATLPPEHGDFDFIVAHGVYSWVPLRVRDALFALADARLGRSGVLYVSYNVLPGCRVRQAVWDTLHHHVDRVADARERLVAARHIAHLVATGGAATLEADQAVRAEFRTIAQRSDSELCHDDLAVPNEPVLFQSFIEHAARYKLRHLADAGSATTSTEGISAEARVALAALDPLALEQALDFIRLRRFRQSLLVREAAAGERIDRPILAREMHVSAAWELARAFTAGEVHKLTRRLEPASGGGGPLRKVLEELAVRQPGAFGIAALESRFGAGSLSRPLEAILQDASNLGIVELHLHPPALAVQPSERPVASPLARLQAAAGHHVTSLLHMAVSIADTNALTLLPLVDGTRDRAALALAVRQLGLPIEASRIDGFVDYALRKFAHLGLLMP